MPDLNQALLEKERADRLQAEQDAQAQEVESQRIVAEKLGYYERLFGNADFQWFLDTLARPAMKTEHDAALDVKKDAQERNNHAQRHDALSLLITGMEVTRTRLRNTLEKQAAKKS